MSNNNASPWWWPLARWWGICGIIIFIGLLMSLIDNEASWYTDQPAPSTERQGTEAPGERPDQRSEASVDRNSP